MFMQTCNTMARHPYLQFLSLKMFKISASDFIALTFCRYIFHTLTEGGVLGLYKAVIQSRFGRTCSSDGYRR